MKKLLVSCSLALAAVTAQASLQKVATVEIADASTLVAAVTKVGQFTGNQMLSAMAAGAIPALPVYKYFGAGRGGVPFVMAFYLDPDILAAACSGDSATAARAMADENGWEWAVAYPVTATAARFRKLHADAVETNGVFAVKSGAGKSASTWYTAFAADGKWATAASKPALAREALELAKVADKPLKDNVARLNVNKHGFAAARNVFAALEKSGKCKELASFDFADACANCSAMIAALRVSDGGIDFSGALKPVAGSPWEKMGVTPLGKDPLAFAGKNAVQAEAAAKGAGNVNPVPKFKQVLERLGKAGLDVSSVAFATKGDASDVTFDVPALAKYMLGNFTDFVEKSKGALEGLDLSATKFVADSEPFAVSFGLKGREGSYTVQERFDATLPEAATKPVDYVKFSSVYSVFHRAKDDIVGALLAQDPSNAMLAPLVNQLGPEAKGGIGVMTWNEKGLLKVLSRLSADEIKGLAGVYNVVFGYAMMQTMQQNAATGGDDGSDDED